MFLIIEIILLIGGAYMLFTGKVPEILIGNPGYKVESGTARALGVLLMAPLPVAIVASILLSMQYGSQGTAYATILEVALVVLTLIAAAVLIRVVREPMAVPGVAGMIMATPTDEWLIGRRVNGSLIYLILGGFGITAIFLCPLAYFRANQALKMIRERNVGQIYLGRAQFVRLASVALLAFWIAICGCVAVPILMASFSG